VLGSKLYFSYSQRSIGYGNQCDSIQNPNGCPVVSVLASADINVSATPKLSNFQTLLSSPSMFCSQFAVGQLNDIIAYGSDILLLSAGTGSSPYTYDYGSFTSLFPQGVCGAGSSAPGTNGAYRAVTNSTLTGKVVAYNVTSKEITVISNGFCNPFRMSLYKNTLLVSDTGCPGSEIEEINLIDLSSWKTATRQHSGGFPCFNAFGVPISAYWTNPLTNTSIPTCNSLATNNDLVMPFFTYDSTSPFLNNTKRVSVSALYATPTSILFGDYSQGAMYSMDWQGKNVQVLLNGRCFPSDIFDAGPGYGLMYVDTVFGVTVPLPQSASGTSSLKLSLSIVFFVVVSMLHGL
jgi:hypothetical protein